MDKFSRSIFNFLNPLNTALSMSTELFSGIVSFPKLVLIVISQKLAILTTTLVLPSKVVLPKRADGNCFQKTK